MKQALAIRVALAGFGLCAGTAAIGTPGASPADPLRLVAESAHVRLSGDATLRRWACTGTNVHAVAVIPLDDGAWAATFEAGLPESLLDLDVPRPAIRARLAIESLRCSSPRMKRDLLEAVRAADHPHVEYVVTGVRDSRRLPDDEDGAPGYDIELVGNLTLAGRPRSTVHTARVRIRDPYTFEIEGIIEMRMSDFGIDPPVALLGLIRVHDDFRVTYGIRTHRESSGQDLTETESTVQEGPHAAHW